MGKKSRLVFLISVFLFCLPNARSGAQQRLPFIDSQKNISMDLQDANLKDILKIFSVQSGLNFIAAQNVESRKITLYLDKVPIKEAMEKLFKTNNLSYEYDEAANIFTVQYWGEPEADKMTKVYKLKYCSLLNSNIEKEKNALFASKGIGSGTAAGSTSSTQTGVGQVAGAGETEGGTNIVNSIKQVLSKDGKVTEDNRTNSLIITDIPSRFPIIEAVIKELDVPQPQVMLEVEMLDVNKNVVDKLGIRFGDISSTTVGNASPITFIGSLTSSLSKADWMFGTAGKRTTEGYLSLGEKYTMLLEFLTQQTDTKYLARPRVLTLNNETAEIGITKDEIVSVNETVSTDQAGIVYTAKTYQRATSLALTPEGIGIFLRVTPRIDLDSGEITMVINPKTSSTVPSSELSGQGTIARDPEVRATKSIIKVKDGETIVLGGLIHQEKNEVRTKLPILGDIPIVGLLFRHKNTTKNIERELLVFITPHIVKESDMKLAQDNKATLSSASRYPATKTQRQEAIADILNSFDKKRNRN